MKRKSKRKKLKPVDPLPECTITFKHWQGHRQIRLRGVPLSMEVRHHPIDIQPLDSYAPRVLSGPSEVTVVFGRGDPKVRVSA